MRRLALFAAVAILMLPVPEPVAAGDLTASQATEVIVSHNAVRKRVLDRLENLSWAHDLAVKAQGWAETLAGQGCAMRHNPDQNNTGENIFWASPVRWSDGRTDIQNISATKVTEAWASERQWYDYERNSCSPGKQCGHYTQVVWASTKEVGCGMAVCPDKAQIWVCNYRPAGNYVGQRPF